MKQRFTEYYMNVAKLTSNLSYCSRAKVGAIIVKNDSIVSIGYNGTLPGNDNICEDINNVTKSSVIHAEMNAILKIAKSNESSLGSSMFCTVSPCVNCAIHIIQSGINEVYYSELYRDDSGIILLEENGVKCIKV